MHGRQCWVARPPNRDLARAKICRILQFINGNRKGSVTGGDDEQIWHEEYEQSARLGFEPCVLWAGAVDRPSAGVLVHHQQLEPAAATDRQHDGGFALIILGRYQPGG
jgi:hypothetical protein